MSNLIEIKEDTFDIAERLKEINPTYRIFFNGIKNRFELHGGKEQGFIAALPFDRLDARTEVYVRKTRIERIEQVMAEIEEHNTRCEKQAVREAKNIASDNLKESVDRVYHDANHRKN